LAAEQGYLPEIPERDAQGSVAATYTDIRRVVGPPVALIYRFLAVTPGLLEGSWVQLAPNLASTAAREARAELGAAGLGGIEPIPRAALADSLDARRTAATVAAYRRANSANLLAMAALLDGVDAPTATGTAAAREDSDEPMLPMADLRALPSGTASLLQEMAAPITGGDPPIVVPSLLLHFAHDPLPPALLWTALRPVLGGEEFTRAAASLSSRARELAATLPYRVEALEDPDARPVVERFVASIIPRMLLTGSLLEIAFAELLDQDGRHVAH
jgi:hypothetical protein